MTETIAVLFIFFVLLLFGMIFYYRYQSTAIQEKKEELLAERAMGTTLRVLFLPELMCTQFTAEPIDNCIDGLKLQQLEPDRGNGGEIAGVIQSNIEDYYFELFSYATITIYEIRLDLDPLEQDPISHVIYDQPKPNSKNTETTFFVVTIREQFPLGREEFRYGYIEVKVYA